MLHPKTIVKHINEHIGYGVFAADFIPKGTITWVRDHLDRELTPADFDTLPDAIREAALTYAYRNKHGNYILPWDNTRFVNHSFFANTMITPYGFEIAICDIKRGQEITNDYGTLNIIESFEPVDEGHHRKMVHPHDILDHHPHWDEQIHASIRAINDVPQHLKQYFSIDQWAVVQQLVAEEMKPASILECYFDGRC